MKRKTYEATNATYRLNPAEIFKLVNLLYGYISRERWEFVDNGGEPDRFRTDFSYCSRLKNRLAINTEVGVPLGAIEVVGSHDVAELILGPSTLTLKINAYKKLDINPEELYAIGELNRTDRQRTPLEGIERAVLHGHTIKSSRSDQGATVVQIDCLGSPVLRDPGEFSHLMPALQEASRDYLSFIHEKPNKGDYHTADKHDLWDMRDYNLFAERTLGKVRVRATKPFKKPIAVVGKSFWTAYQTLCKLVAEETKADT